MRGRRGDSREVLSLDPPANYALLRERVRTPTPARATARIPDQAHPDKSQNRQRQAKHALKALFGGKHLSVVSRWDRGLDVVEKKLGIGSGQETGEEHPNPYLYRLAECKGVWGMPGWGERGVRG